MTKAQEVIQNLVETCKKDSSSIIVLIVYNNVEIFRHKFKYNKHMEIINTHSWRSNSHSLGLKCPCGYSFLPSRFIKAYNAKNTKSQILFRFSGIDARKIQRCSLTKDDLTVYDVMT